MRGIIRLGDPTSHGGTVIGATSRVTVGGMPVARLGDPCICPLPGHAGCVIVEADPSVTIDGAPIAFHGHKTSCGASLISTIPTSGQE